MEVDKNLAVITVKAMLDKALVCLKPAVLEN